MEISKQEWNKYINLLSAANKTAAKKMQAWIGQHGYGDAQAMIDYAYSLTTAYGEAAASIACQMYEEVAAAQNAAVPQAVPADALPYNYVKAAVEDKITRAPAQIPDTVGEMVKRTGADTTVKNALRDGAYFAWIPHGDACAFCIMLASNGWQRASKKTIKGGHAEHIHKNCQCEFAISFDGPGNVEGYDPDEYYRMWEEGHGNLDGLREKLYWDRHDKILAQKREWYARTIVAKEGGDPYKGQTFNSKSVIINIKNYDDLKGHFSENFGIQINAFENCDLEKTKITMMGVDDCLTAFPEAQPKVTRIVYKPELGSMGGYDKETGIIYIGPTGLNSYLTGYHESIHALDAAFSGETGYTFSDGLFKRARKELGLRKGSKKLERLQYEIVGQDIKKHKVKDKPEEILAYGIERELAGKGNELSATMARLFTEEINVRRLTRRLDDTKALV